MKLSVRQLSFQLSRALVLTGFAFGSVVSGCAQEKNFVSSDQASDLDNFDPDAWEEPVNRDNATELHVLNTELQRAMRGGEKEKVRQIVSALRDELGQFAGYPEKRPSYAAAPDQSSPSLRELDNLEASWSQIGGKFAPRMNWADGVIDTQREAESIARLREAGWYGQSLLIYAFAKTERSLKNQAIAAAEFVVTQQASNGVFGFPYPAKDTRVGRGAAKIVTRARARGFEPVEGDWIIRDFSDEGGLGFDNGVVGLFLVNMHAATGDARYLDAALKAGVWASRYPLSSNFNYNVFSGQLFSALYRATCEAKWLVRAQHVFEIGVLPGQLESGRWIDPHNARIEYHSILVWGMQEYYLALASAGLIDHVKDVEDRLVRATNHLAHQQIVYGPSSLSVAPLKSLIRAQFLFGHSDFWENAINVNVNYATAELIDEAVARDVPPPHELGYYLAYKLDKAALSKDFSFSANRVDSRCPKNSDIPPFQVEL
ncbi:MAG: hypothetical protein AAF291_00325 [Pseudomonadota bacterium]